ncbi:MAG TPA: hypothetical protein PKN33_06835 [Phycisphaerae bacterium]|nr:hypothetical protein [Phycisphaerae bacterium]
MRCVEFISPRHSIVRTVGVGLLFGVFVSMCSACWSQTVSAGVLTFSVFGSLIGYSLFIASKESRGWHRSLGGLCVGVGLLLTLAFFETLWEKGSDRFHGDAWDEVYLCAFVLCILPVWSYGWGRDFNELRVFLYRVYEQEWEVRQGSNARLWIAHESYFWSPRGAALGGLGLGFGLILLAGLLHNIILFSNRDIASPSKVLSISIVASMTLLIFFSIAYNSRSLSTRTLVVIYAVGFCAGGLAGITMAQALGPIPALDAIFPHALLYLTLAVPVVVFVSIVIWAGFTVRNDRTDRTIGVIFPGVLICMRCRKQMSEGAAACCSQCGAEFFEMEWELEQPSVHCCLDRGELD